MTSLHPKTPIGLVALTVANRERSVALYQDMPGIMFIELGNAGVIMVTEAAAPLLLLTEQAGARPKPSSTTGLDHFAPLLKKITLAWRLPVFLLSGRNVVLPCVTRGTMATGFPHLTSG
jgi:catechol-2,3-dioxygenase